MGDRWNLAITTVATVFLGAVGGFAVGNLIGKDIVLKDWQLLMAALIAVGGATLAYHAAMAKVAFDRETRDRDLGRRRLGLQMRLGYALELCRAEAQHAMKLEPRSVDAVNPRKLVLQDVTIPRHREFEEAWKNLEHFSRKVVFGLANLRSQFRSLEEFVKTNPPLTTEWTLRGYDTPNEVTVLFNVIRDIERFANSTLTALQDDLPDH